MRKVQQLFKAPSLSPPSHQISTYMERQQRTEDQFYKSFPHSKSQLEETRSRGNFSSYYEQLSEQKPLIFSNKINDWNLKMENDRLRKQIENLVESNSQLQSELLYLKNSQVDKFENDHDNLNKLMQGYQRKAQERKAIMKQLYGILKTKDQEIDKIRDCFENQIEEMNKQMILLKEQCDMQIFQQENKVNQIEQVINSILNLKQQKLHELEKKELKMKEILQKLLKKQENKDKIEEVKNILIFIGREKQKYQCNFPQFMNNQNNLQKEYQKIVTQHESLMVQINRLNQLLNEQAKPTYENDDQIYQLSVNIKDLIKQNNFLKKQISQQNDEINKQNNKLEKYKNSSEQKSNQLEQLRADLKNITSQLLNQDTINQLNDCIKKQTNQIEALQQKLRDQNNILERNEHLLQEQQQKENQLLLELKSIKQERVKSLQYDDQEFSKYNSNIRSLNQEIEDLNSQLESMYTQQALLQSQFDENEIESKKQLIQHTNTIQKLQMEIKNYQQQIEDNKLEFNQKIKKQQLSHKQRQQELINSQNQLQSQLDEYLKTIDTLKNQKSYSQILENLVDNINLVIKQKLLQNLKASFTNSSLSPGRVISNSSSPSRQQLFQTNQNNIDLTKIHITLESISDQFQNRIHQLLKKEEKQLELISHFNQQLEESQLTIQRLCDDNEQQKQTISILYQHLQIEKLEDLNFRKSLKDEDQQCLEMLNKNNVQTQQLINQNQQLQQDIQQQQIIIKDYEIQLDHMRNQIDYLTQEKEEQNNQNNQPHQFSARKESIIQILQNDEIQNKDQQIKDLLNKQTTVELQIQKLQENIEQLQSQIKLKENEIDNLQLQNKDMQEKQQYYEQLVNELNSYHQQFKNQQEVQVIKLEGVSYDNSHNSFNYDLMRTPTNNNYIIDEIQQESYNSSISSISQQSPNTQIKQIIQTNKLQEENIQQQSRQIYEKDVEIQKEKQEIERLQLQNQLQQQEIYALQCCSKDQQDKLNQFQQKISTEQEYQKLQKQLNILGQQNVQLENESNNLNNQLKELSVKYQQQDLIIQQLKYENKEYAENIKFQGDEQISQNQKISIFTYNLKNQIKQFKTQSIQDQRILAQCLQTLNSQLNLEIENFGKQFKDFNQQLEEKDQFITNLESEYQLVKKDQQQAQKDLDKLRENIKNKEKQIDSLNQNLQQSQTSLEINLQEIQTLQDQVKSLQQQIENKDKQQLQMIEYQKNEIKQKQNILNDNQRKFQLFEEENSLLKDQQKTQKINFENQIIQQQILIENQRNQILNLDQENEQLNFNLECIQNEFNKIKVELEAIQNELKVYKNQNNNLKQENEELKTQLLFLNQNVDESQNNLQETQQRQQIEIFKFENEKQLFAKQITELQENLLNKNRQLELNSQEQQEKNLIILNLKNQLKEQQQNIEVQQKEFQILDAQLQNSQEKCQQQNLEIQSLNKELILKENKNLQLNDQIKQINEQFEQQQNQFQNEIKQEKQNNQTSSNQNQQLKIKIKTLNEQIELQNNQILDLQNQKNNLSQQIIQLQNQYQQTKQQQSLETSKNQAAVSKQLEDLNQKIITLESELSIQEKNLANIKQENLNQLILINAKDQEIQSIQTELEQKETLYQGKIRELNLNSSKELNQLNAQNQNLVSQLQNKTQENIKLVENLNNKKLENEQGIIKLKDTENKVKSFQLQIENQKLRQENILQEQLLKDEQQTQLLNSKDILIQNQESIIKGLQQKNSELNKLFKEKQTYNEELKTQLSLVQQQQIQQMLQFQQVSDDNKQKDDQILNYKSKNESLIQEQLNLKQNEEVLKYKVTQFQEKNETFQQQIQELQQTIKEMQSNIKQLKEQEIQYQQLNKQLETELQLLRADIEDYQNENSQLKLELLEIEDQKNKQIRQAEQKLEKAENERVEHDLNLQNRINLQQEKIIELENKEKLLNELIKNVQQKLEQQYSDREILTQSKNELLKNLQTEKSSLLNQINQITESSVQQINELMNQINELNKQLSKTNNYLQVQQCENQEIQILMNQKDQKLEIQEIQIKKQTQQLNQYEDEIIELNQELKIKEDQLKIQSEQQDDKKALITEELNQIQQDFSMDLSKNQEFQLQGGKPDSQVCLQLNQEKDLSFEKRASQQQVFEVKSQIQENSVTDRQQCISVLNGLSGNASENFENNLMKSSVNQNQKILNLQDKIAQLYDENDKLKRQQLQSIDDFIETSPLKESDLIKQLKNQIEILTSDKEQGRTKSELQNEILNQEKQIQKRNQQISDLKKQNNLILEMCEKASIQDRDWIIELNTLEEEIAKKWLIICNKLQEYEQIQGENLRFQNEIIELQQKINNKENLSLKSIIVKQSQSFDDEDIFSMRSTVTKLKQEVEHQKNKNQKLNTLIKSFEKDEQRFEEQNQRIKEENKQLRNKIEELQQEIKQLNEKLQNCQGGALVSSLIYLLNKFFESYSKENKQDLKVYYQSIISLAQLDYNEQLITRLQQSLEKKGQGVFGIFKRDKSKDK